jgi:uroporphyrinogen decarboxylase
MEKYGKVHPYHRNYFQWNQMSRTERNLHIKDMAKIYVDTAVDYGHDAIFVHFNPHKLENILALLEEIRNISGNEFFLMMHGDATLEIPSGDKMMEFSAQIYEEPQKLIGIQKSNIKDITLIAQAVAKNKGLLDAFALCSDYAFNTNPFFSPDMFSDLIAPILSEEIEMYRSLGFYTIKHTDGNINPIMEQILQCKPDAIHSIDPQGQMNLGDVRRKYGGRVATIGNVNCGLLQTGTEEEVIRDVKRTIDEGMINEGRGFVFSTSNCVYTGMSLERYELMLKTFREYCKLT